MLYYDYEFHPTDSKQAMKYFVVHTILLSLLLMSCASQPVNAQTQGEPVFSITQKNQEDQISIQYENGAAIININSPFGIGSAKFELESGAMPEKIVLQLHLKGLEEFRLASSQTAIAASVSSSEVFNVHNQRIISSGSEYSILPIHPLWLNIEIISDQTIEKIPLEEGYFEITFPKEFVQKAGNSFEIQWIDFYR